MNQMLAAPPRGWKRLCMTVPTAVALQGRWLGRWVMIGREIDD